MCVNKQKAEAEVSWFYFVLFYLFTKGEVEGGSFLKETTQAKVNNADTWNICAVLNQDGFLLGRID